MPQETFESILSAVKKRQFAPLYFLCGEEPFFIDKLTDALEGGVLNEMEKAFNQTIVYGKDVNARQILETCGRLPMMAERQLVIVKEAQALSLKEDEEEQYLRYISKPVKSTVLVFAWKYGKPDGRKKFGKEMAKQAVYFESKPLYDNQLAPWVRNWLSEHRYKMDEQAVELLIEFTGNNLSNLHNELEKLIIGKPSGAVITADDVERFVGVSKEFNVFELANAVMAKQKSKAYRIVDYFKANPKNGPLVLVLSTLYTSFTRVMLYQQHRGLSEMDLAALLKVNKFFVKDYRPALPLYSPQKLEQIFLLLEEYDLRSKGVNSGDTEENQLLRELVYRIMS